MIYNILYFFLGSLITFLLLKRKRKKVIPKRTGLLNRTYQSQDGANVPVEFEILEINKSTNKSKIQVLNLIVTKSEWNDPISKKKIKEMVDNSWVDSSDVSWLDLEDPAQIRADKINKLLK